MKFDINPFTLYSRKNSKANDIVETKMAENSRTNVKILIAAFIPMVIMSIIRMLSSNELEHNAN
jgi:hypothetical protein